MPPLEAWEKVFVSQEKFVDSDPHAKTTTCIQCHGGVSGAEDMAEAHAGVVVDPTKDQESVGKLCGACHTEITAAQVKSLHFDSHGYDTIIGQRLGDAPESHKAWETAEANHCSSCHTTCGQCHVSQPTSVGGGLVSGHQFKATQAFTRTCTGCHGSRINAEYTGLNEGVPADVHWTQGGMPCFKCHTGDALHGMTGEDWRAWREDRTLRRQADAGLHGLPSGRDLGQERDPAAQCSRREAGLSGVPQRRKQKLLRLPRADQR